MTFNNSHFHIKFGPIIARIEYEYQFNHIADIIKNWLKSGIHTIDCIPDITFEIRNELTNPTNNEPTLISGNGRYYNKQIRSWDGRGWENLISRDSTKAYSNIKWECSPRNGVILSIAKHIPKFILRFAHEHYFSYDEMLASTFLYRQLIPAVQISLLENDATFIHSSALNKNDNYGILISGWGGSGKTSASSWLYLNEPDTWQYLSDDLAILTGEGFIHFSPIPMNIFPYNTLQFPQLKNELFKEMGCIEKLHWKVRHCIGGPSSVVRRRSALNPLTNQDGVQLKLAIHLQRTDSNKASINKCTPAEISIVAKNILSYELRHGWQTLLIANAFINDGDKILPSPDELACIAEEIFRRSFKYCELANVEIPHNFTPHEVSQVVKELTS